jgi:hypothetical protein
MLVKRFAFRCFDHPNLSPFRLIFLLYSAVFLWHPSAKGEVSYHINAEAANSAHDTVHQKKMNKADSAAYKNSRVFYDTVYKKFSRNKISQMLYGLAFAVPRQSDLPDTLQVLKSNSPFEAYQGKIIRNIVVKVLPPFGASVYDTGKMAVTGVGKALNSVHINTRKYVIRRNLLVKNGDRIDPAFLADNERVLRNMSSIDNARIIVVQDRPDSDSVDLLVVVKDVWSIGIDIPMITMQHVRVRLYDGNFLGLGDRLSTMMSMDLYSAPFYIFEGLSYTYSNIGRSQINATIGYSADHTGNRIILLRLDRSFLTNQTKWAGSAYASWETAVNKIGDTASITSHFRNEGIWLGRAYLLKGQKETSRAVISAAAYRKVYNSRPMVTIDSNRSYYNTLQGLASFSISRNNYYLSDYILDFGTTENLPYGHLFQITVGADQSDFYTRLYSGLHVSMGNFFNKFGYISSYFKFGGFFNHSSFEDAVVKFNLHYFTPLLKTHDKRYKFRLFYMADYRYAINPRSNNRDYYDANLNFKIDKPGDESYFNGVNIFSQRLASVCFTPWYFFGFRFAVMMEVQAGLVGKKKEPLYKAPMFSSIGLSIIIKNDNLIFPAFLISGYFYPSSLGNFRQLQYTLSSNLNVEYYDFNVTAPHEENLGN